LAGWRTVIAQRTVAAATAAAKLMLTADPNHVNLHRFCYRGMTVRPLAIVLLTGLVASASTATQSSDAAAVATRVQARYATIRDFEGEFVQTYEGGVLRTRTSESGTMAIRQPGQFRFIYTKPERKEFVSDGSTIYTYLVADKQVIVTPAPGPGETTPALFLAGRADIARDFTPSTVSLPSAPAGVVTIKLDPRKADPDYQWFAIGVEPTSFQIRYLVALDRQGGRSAFTFSNVKENRGLADNTFRFRIPRGVDVVNHAGRQP
jgi:outer membrane lipoprotein carrier protein